MERDQYSNGQQQVTILAYTKSTMVNKVCLAIWLYDLTNLYPVYVSTIASFDVVAIFLTVI